MSNSYQVIDEKTWERAMHCFIFRDSIEPVPYMKIPICHMDA